MENCETLEPMKTPVYSTLIILSIIVLTSCSARRVNKDMSSTNNPLIEEGRLIFKYHCQKCHPNGESGVGPPINNIKLPGFLTRARIRSRAFLLWTGRMPEFKKDEISKKDMKALMAYINDMKKKESPAPE